MIKMGKAIKFRCATRYPVLHIEIEEDHFRRSNISLTQVEKFYRKWEGKLYYRGLRG